VRPKRGGGDQSESGGATDPPFYVYVIELDGDGSELYVGYSQNPPEIRLARQLSRKPNSSAKIFRTGGRTGQLRPDLYEHLNPIKSKHRAIRLERHLCNSLANRGFRVHGDQVAEAKRRRDQAAARNRSPSN
jgi:hypothetical protein